MKMVSETKVQIKWFVWSEDVKMRREASMRGTWGWDAECSCGWSTKTGGGTYPSVAAEVNKHKYFEHDYRYLVTETN